MPLHTFSVNQAFAALPGFPTLRGVRTRLRAPSPGDAQAVFALYSDPRVMRYWPRAPMVELREAQLWVREALACFDDRTRIEWIVTARDDDRALGTCTLFNFVGRAHAAWVGYALHPDAWGRGLARDAVSRAMAWGEATLGLQRFDANAEPDNAASLRLLSDLGFQRGDSPAHHWRDCR
jgi:ribosomal-protein-alanine N-acetyltransferase